MAENTQPHFCAYPWQQMIIDLTGEVVPCCFWSGYGNTGKPLGNTNENTLEEIWNGPEYQKLREANASGDLKAHPCHECLSYRWSNNTYPRFSSPALLSHEDGFCYLLGELSESLEEASAEGFVGWQLYEDEIPLPLAAALHDDIRHLGQGRYSLWQRSIYLSASDNSDPRENGRRYTLRKDGRVIEIPAGFEVESLSGRNLLLARVEYQQGKKELESKPSMISLISTADCNIDCPGCSQNTVRLTRVQHRPQTVPDVLAHVPYLHQFIWHGGEPYLIKQFRQFVDDFKTSDNPNLCFGFTSNGTMLTEKEQRKLLKFPRINASISIDSFQPATFEKIRAGASYERVIANFLSTLRQQRRPDFTLSCGMIICKSNFLELADNLRYAIANDIGLNLSPVLIYPVTEQLNQFEDFERETKGWQEALDEAQQIVFRAKKEGRRAIRHVDQTGMLDELQLQLDLSRSRYQDAATWNVQVHDDYRSIRHMRRPGLIVHETVSGTPLGYLQLAPGISSYTLRLPRAIDIRSTYLRVVHDLFEPMGYVSQLLFEDGLPQDVISIHVPRFLPVIRPANHTYANYGECSPEGLNVTDTEEITHQYEQRLAEERKHVLDTPITHLEMTGVIFRKGARKLRQHVQERIAHLTK